MAHFEKPLYVGNDGYKLKSDGSLSAMSIASSTAGTKKQVVVWGGGDRGEVLSLVARDYDGAMLADTRLIGQEKGHPPEPGGDDEWYMLYELEVVKGGCGSLRAVDKLRRPFAAIDLTVGSATAKRALFIIPSQGKDTGAFQGVAQKLTSDIYGGRAVTVKSIVSSGRKFSFVKGGKPYTIGSDKGFSTVIIISHGGVDGPNLAYNDSSVDDHQPLRMDDDATSADARIFWQTLGHALDGCGKIILLGCGEAGLAPKVATEAVRRVYANPGLCAAGNEDYAMRNVKAVESGAPIPPMQQFDP
jgi:hypothetical protein